MLRGEFIARLGSVAVWSVVARAQQPALPVIGVLGVQSADVSYEISTGTLLGHRGGVIPGEAWPPAPGAPRNELTHPRAGDQFFEVKWGRQGTAVGFNIPPAA
jgi:hypothetical protein